MSNPVEVTTARPAPDARYASGRISLYGIPLAELTFGQIHVNAMATPINRFETALVYGYSYQGHCFNLSEPVALVVERTARQSAVTGCGYDPNLYVMWNVDKLDTTVLIQATGDTFDEVVLRRNLGTTKQPVSYHSAMLASHRGGKLIE